MHSQNSVCWRLWILWTSQSGHSMNASSYAPEYTDIALYAGPERQLLWHAVQQQRLQGSSLPYGPAAGAVPHQGFRWWQDSHCHGHLPVLGSDEGSPYRPGPQVGSMLRASSLLCLCQQAFAQSLFRPRLSGQLSL